MNDHDKDSYDVTTGIMLTVKEKLENISVRFKLWKISPLIAGAVVIVIAVAVIIGIAFAKEHEPVFEAPCESEFEDRFVTKKKDGITVSMRVSDIRLYDHDTRTSFSTLEYETDSDDILIVADIIFTNNSDEELVLNGPSAGIALGYAKDVKYKHNGWNDAYVVNGEMYLQESDEYDMHYSLTIAPGESAENRFRFIYPACYADKIDTLYFCRRWVDDNHEENVYEVLGVGEPYLTMRLNNRKLFPKLTKTEE